MSSSGDVQMEVPAVPQVPGAPQVPEVPQIPQVPGVPETSVQNGGLVTEAQPVTMDYIVSVLSAKLMNPIVNSDRPLASEVLTEEDWAVRFPNHEIHIGPHDVTRLHVRTDAEGGRVPCGSIRVRDAAAGMAYPSAFLGPCIVRGFGGGKIMLSRMMDREVPMGDVRHQYLVNAYLSYSISPTMSTRTWPAAVGDGGPLRDVVLVLKESEKKYASLLLAMARLGHGPVLQPIVGSVQAWSKGRVEILVRTPEHQNRANVNGVVHTCVLGAAGVQNVHQNRVHPVVRQSLNIMGEVHIAVSLSMQQLRHSLLIFRAVLRFSYDANVSRLLNDLKESGALLDDNVVRSEAEAKVYALNVLNLVSSTRYLMNSWRIAPKEVLSDQNIFNRILSIVAPIITATVSYEGHAMLDAACPILGGTFLPFMAVDGNGVHIRGPWPKTKEDVIVEWILSILRRAHDFLAARFGADHVREQHVLKKIMDILVPSFEPVTQAAFLSLLHSRPGYEGGLSYDIEGSSLHLYLTKNEVSGWSPRKVQQYQIPFHSLSAMREEAVHVSVHDEVRVREEETQIHVQYNLKAKMDSVPSFKDAMSGVINDDIIGVLYNHCQNNATITDNHVELVPVPSSFWGTDFLSCSTEQRSVLQFVFYKRLADVVSEWKQADKNGAWDTGFVRYK